MPTSTSRFWLGKLEFTGLGADGLRRNLRPAVLSGGRVEGDRETIWIVAEVGLVPDSDVLVGKLGKCRRPEVLRPPDESHKSFYRERLDSEVVDAVVWFVMDPNRGLVAIQDRPHDVSANQAIENLCSVVNSTTTAQSEGGNLAIRQLRERGEKVLPSLSRFIRLERMCVELEPSNPETSEEGTTIDQYIRELHADRVKIEAESSKRGLNPEATLMRSPLSHADAGYGTARVEGADKDGKATSVSTQGGPLTVEVVVNEGDPARQWAKDVAAEADRVTGKVDASGLLE